MQILWTSYRLGYFYLFIYLFIYLFDCCINTLLFLKRSITWNIVYWDLLIYMIKFGHSQISVPKIGIRVLNIFHFWGSQSSELEMQDSHRSFYTTTVTYIKKDLPTPYLYLHKRWSGEGWNLSSGSKLKCSKLSDGWHTFLRYTFFILYNCLKRAKCTFLP